MTATTARFLLWVPRVLGIVTKLRLKPPSEELPRRHGEPSLLDPRPRMRPRLRQLLKPKTCLIRTDIGFRRCLVSIFLSLFALDAFTEGKPLLQAVSDFVIHLAPSALLLAIVAASW
jgi:hypothetical protein